MSAIVDDAVSGLVEELRAAMPEVPSGPWHMQDFDVELSVATADGSAPLICDLVEQGDAREPGHWGSEYQIGKWIALCSPANIATLLARIADLQDAVRVKDEALRPFATIAEDYADQEDDDFQVWRDFDVLGATLPLRIFRRARTALSNGEPNAN